MMCKFVCIAFAIVLEVSGHGMMLGPPMRSSLWRFDDDAPVNYEDNELFCGGAFIQHGPINKGRCGLCGDNFADTQPRVNENTGKFGQGKIVAEYENGQIVTTDINLVANHLGRFEYHLCQLVDSSQFESGEECFKALKFADGSDKYPILAGMKGKINNDIKLPAGFRCPHCVLRWQYIAANNWGTCEDGSEGMGCGPQEYYRNCADISIV